MSDEVEVNRLIVDPNVAAADQSKAEALDVLREADAYLLLIPMQDGVRVASTATLEQMFACWGALREALHVQLDIALDEVDDEEEAA